MNRGVLSSQVAVVAIDCWYQEGMCRRSVQGLAFPVVYGHTAGQQILYPQGLREDELVGIYIYIYIYICSPTSISIIICNILVFLI